MSQTRIFQCPTCREFIATDAKICRFCSMPIDAQTAQSAADAQALENSQYRKKQYARHIMIGGGIFVLGLIFTVGSYISASEGVSFVITYGLMLVGVGDLLYGLVGWLGELRID
jgi:amino acid permease